MTKSLNLESFNLCFGDNRCVCISVNSPYQSEFRYKAYGSCYITLYRVALIDFLVFLLLSPAKALAFDYLFDQYKVKFSSYFGTWNVKY